MRGLAHDAAHGLASLDALANRQEMQLIKRVKRVP